MLERLDHNGIVELRLARAPVNALNLDLLNALQQAIEAAPDQGARALILSGRAGLFSAGLDLPWLLQQDITQVEATWAAFIGTCRALASSPLLSVAAIGGHSPAGGAVLGLYCDQRIMAQGDYRIGLNEVAVGLFVPEAIQYALRRLIGIRQAERLLLSGAMIPATRAHQIGLVDELVAADAVVPRALEGLQTLLQLPQTAQQITRRIARQDLIDSITDPARIDLPAFLQSWRNPQTQTTLQTVVARLGKG